MSYKTIKTLTTWQPFLFKGNFIMNMHEAVETNLLPMKSHVTIKYSSISTTSYRKIVLLKLESVIKYG